jgi:hypothetical protein
MALGIETAGNNPLLSLCSVVIQKDDLPGLAVVIQRTTQLVESFGDDFGRRSLRYRTPDKKKVKPITTVSAMGQTTMTEAT